ncbi:MAG: hypothetical protein JWN44_1282 [Myxococcales bacterium]|nr:hypothetical protein [Myxococcales bacterium]
MSDLRERFAPLPADHLALWKTVFAPDGTMPLFPRLVGLVLEDVRADYARMRLPFRPELNQPGGVVHGGAIATLIDTVVVPAIASAYPTVPQMLTISMTIDYLGGLRAEDAIAEGWVEKRGKRTVFCRAEVRSARGELVTRASLVYSVRSS